MEKNFYIGKAVAEIFGALCAGGIGAYNLNKALKMKK